MTVLFVTLAVAAVLIAAYRTYGRWLASRVFHLSDENPTPAHELNDGRDFVPTSTSVLFGHHFTSIAGTGPIVGPAVAVVWGWLPALLWIVLGSIFIGAVHDFGSLVVSIRRRGQTIGEVAGELVHPRVRWLFTTVLVLALAIVLAIFGLVIAAVFRAYPSSITPCLLQIPLAIVVGALMRRGGSLAGLSIGALALMYAGVIFGDTGVLGTFNAYAAGVPTLVWVVGLLAYSYVASVLPVGVLLQPRDYINALQLVTALGLVVLGLVTASAIGGVAIGGDGNRLPLTFAAPAVRWDVPGAPLMFPFLFVTIACGACSGFHCLVSSGTSSKQLRRDTDALAIGYGSMLGEAFLATVVVLACVAGLGLGVNADGGWVAGSDAYQSRYAVWGGGAALSTKLSGFVDGSANLLHSIGVPGSAAVAIMGVLVASFAGTTMDTACRLQRYVIQDLAGGVADRATGGTALHRIARALAGRHVATTVAVVSALAIAALPGVATPQSFFEANRGGGGWDWLMKYGGTGGMILWPLFGATNQLLAGMALMVVTFSLWRRGVAWWFVAVPAVFMLSVPLVAMVMLVRQTFASESPGVTVLVIGVATVALQLWMMAEAAMALSPFASRK